MVTPTAGNPATCRLCRRAVPEGRALLPDPAGNTAICFDCVIGTPPLSPETPAVRLVVPDEWEARPLLASWVFWAFMVAGCAMWLFGAVTAVLMMRAVMR